MSQTSPAIMHLQESQRKVNARMSLIADQIAGRARRSKPVDQLRHEYDEWTIAAQSIESALHRLQVNGRQG